MQHLKLNVVIILVFLGCLSCSTPKQKLVYDSWVLVRFDKKDGSRYVDRNGYDKRISEIIITPQNIQTVFKQPCSIYLDNAFSWVGDSIVKYGNDFYQINSVDDTSLVLLENNDKREADVINRLLLIRNRYYPTYLINSNQANFLSDSTIIPINYFINYYTGRWDMRIWEEINKSNMKGDFTLSIILDAAGTVLKTDVVKNNGADNKIVSKVVDVVKETKSWSFPQFKSPICFKADLTVHLNPKVFNKGANLWISPIFDEPIVKREISRKLSLFEIDSIRVFYTQGLKFVENSNFENAVYAFSKCITIDSMWRDAYYNRAFANFNINQIEKSCIDWGYLYKQLGQKPAEKLYNENCISNKANVISNPTSGVKQ